MPDRTLGSIRRTFSGDGSHHRKSTGVHRSALLDRNKSAPEAAGFGH
jgi:hypothetical protein